jgi:hypothetical protein
MCREQKNHHQAEVFEFLRFYLTLITGLLAAELTLCTFAIPRIATSLPNPQLRSATIILLLTPLPITILGLVHLARTNVNKAYQKNLEHLTVEQKIEAALGLAGPLRVAQLPATEEVPFPEDASILFARWIAGSRAVSSSAKFVAKVQKGRDVIRTPVNRALFLIAATDVALLLSLVVYAIAA